MALIGFYNYNFPCYSTQCCLTVVSSWTISMPLILAVSADSEKKKKDEKENKTANKVANLNHPSSLS